MKDVVSAPAGIGELKTAVASIDIQNLYTAVADNGWERVAVLDIGFGSKDVAVVDNGWELAAAGIGEKVAVADFVRRNLVHRIGTGLAGQD